MLFTFSSAPRFTFIIISFSFAITPFFFFLFITSESVAIFFSLLSVS